jgi:hypothetical protein
MFTSYESSKPFNSHDSIAIILDPIADIDLEKYIYGESDLKIERNPVLFRLGLDV